MTDRDDRGRQVPAPIRRIRPDEGGELRAVRLAALADSPSAFASTFEDELRLPDQHWAACARTRSTGDEAITLVAVGPNGGWVGVVGGFRDPAGPDVVNLVSMWVAPSARVTGVGGRLVDALVEWAAQTGASCVELWVTQGNEHARRLYARHGFAVTGEVTPLPSDPCHDEIRMRLELRCPGATNDE